MNLNNLSDVKGADKAKLRTLKRSAVVVEELLCIVWCNMEELGRRMNSERFNFM